MARKPLDPWTEETLFTTGDEYFARLLEAISSAQTSIELESYIFARGILGNRIVEHLIAASHRGLRVRLIIDGWGSPDFVWSYWPQLRAAGIRVRFFRVTPWILRRLPGDPASPFRRFVRRWQRANRGNHRKFCLIDHRELWVGSYNISDVHLREVFGSEAWQDVGVRVCGPEVRFAKRAFQRAYWRWASLQVPRRAPRLLLLNDSYLHKRRARVEQLRRLRHAHARVWLATPYFVPVGPLFRLLARQAAKGHDVRVMVPEKNDVWFVKWMSLPLLAALAKKGVKIFIFSPRFAHQKLFIVDNWVALGSTNLNHRSFLHDLEMDVVITHPDNHQTILDSYVRDQALSRPFDSREWSRLPWWQKLLSSIFLLGKYWS